MTDSGRQIWHERALPKIRGYYDQILGDFSINDVSHTLHYLLKLLGNMQRVDSDWLRGEPEPNDSEDTSEYEDESLEQGTGGRQRAKPGNGVGERLASTAQESSKRRSQR